MGHTEYVILSGGEYEVWKLNYRYKEMLNYGIEAIIGKYRSLLKLSKDEAQTALV